MTHSDPSNSFIRNEREAKIAARADQLAAIFAERAPKHDLDGTFPFENFNELRETGYLALTVPKQYGGEEASIYELVLSQERLARGDGSTALAVGWHIGLLKQLHLSGACPEPLFSELCHEVVNDGLVMNELASERATGSPTRGGKPQTKAVKVDGGWLISGQKSFCTLSPILKKFIISATMSDTDTVGSFLVEAGEGVEIIETWNTIGMRSTGSHDIVMNEVFVPDRHLIRGRASDQLRKPVPTDGNMLHIPACYLGIAHGARDFAIDFAAKHQPNSLQTPIAELPNIKRLIGEIELDLTTARTYLYHTADRWDKEVDNRAELKIELGVAKHVATNAALRVVDHAMRIVGGLSLSRAFPLERMYRDVRAGLHNPPMDDIVITNLANRALGK
ncbi:acyl-CoA dehydrogenase family protein [Paenibacillus pinihumi]|uniref:acyl-CoA dehydrogenase family protein n=1 Tax=Paenibacillus pinihumi TaxID=669462 RepID=UPI000491C159|nr:acyl-CoA dehydrogenase family protein [Paenibacillus pinihumi]